LLAQLLARADLWGSVYRIKGMAETGVPDFRTDTLITAGVALATGAVTLATFAFAFGAGIAAILVGALLVHEFGHLLAYRLIGQPWGRMVFLPFLGAVAVPRIGFTTQAQLVFAALMGPGFSVLIPVLVAMHVLLSLPGQELAIAMGIVSVALNLFNLLPVEPLDGGLALRSIMGRIAGRHAQKGLLLVAMAIVAVGWHFEQVLFMIFGGLAVLANLRPRTIDAGLQPLTTLQVAISIFAFVSIVTAYVELLQFFLAMPAKA
jgi:Zn-dependent protease